MRSSCKSTPAPSVLVIVAMLGSACGGQGQGQAVLAPVTPPVRAAAPAALANASAQLFASPTARAVMAGLSASDFQSRFFDSGPTDLFDLLAQIDDRIAGINQQSEQETNASSCLSQAPVAYDISPWGQTVTLYAQCVEPVSVPDSTGGDASNFVQWGVNEGVTYLYVAVGAEHAAVIATPAGTAGDVRIQGWFGVGYTNASCGPGTWDGCSYGVMQLLADASGGVFELSVAGVGFGYCGAQLKASGAVVYAVGSTDMGTTCGEPASLCVNASDFSTPANCVAVGDFVLPALGRAAVQGSDAPPIDGAVFGASAYPLGGPNITLNGTATDDLAFGPPVPTSGAGTF